MSTKSWKRQLIPSGGAEGDTRAFFCSLLFSLFLPFFTLSFRSSSFPLDSSLMSFTPWIVLQDERKEGIFGSLARWDALLDHAAFASRLIHSHANTRCRWQRICARRIRPRVHLHPLTAFYSATTSLSLCFFSDGPQTHSWPGLYVSKLPPPALFGFGFFAHRTSLSPANSATPLSTGSDTDRTPLQLHFSSFPTPFSISGSFHSLTKVLFIFRSHYFFAIGLSLIFRIIADARDSFSYTIK